MEHEFLFGWDATPGIVSVWAEREGRALVWRRVEGRVVCERERFRPWLYAATLDDLAPIADAVAPEGSSGAARAEVTYRELEGPAGSLRFLLSAQSGRAMERAILAGASRRLGRTVETLHELERDYYAVGPVEQYLMLTGRCYFQGMTYGDVHRLQFDLETTGLGAGQARIFMAAVHDNRGLEVVLEAPRAADEAGMIEALCALIRARDPDVIENHNLFGFDLPFLEMRAKALGVELRLGRAEGPQRLERYADPTSGYPGARRRFRYSVAGREMIDTLDAVRRHDFVARELPSHGLKAAARHFGVAAPERVYIDAARSWEIYRQDPAQVRAYALDDVVEVDGLSQRLMTPVFALAGMAPRRYERLASAGPAMGILEPMLVRAYLRAGAALPRAAGGRNPALGRHAGGAAYLLAAGVAERVVKADIASLYPSIMRTFRIGPWTDRLGVLLEIVDRLTEMRLGHKAKLRTAEAGSAVAGHHHAMQAAMKLLINSAYGYMGAGAMALFADAQAADEVTRRGRELLDQVVEQLGARGVALIEADTDGVYFAAPPEWGEAEERALVAEVAKLLPEGIHLDYEGRYRAMFSHEVKNYALLRYDGELIVRGAALRSSRSEPFGERFLREALVCLMRGDVAGVRAAYLATQAALRERRLGPEDVAARVRLSKSSEQYLKTRAGQREPQYEALLQSGRTRWPAGERVRFYRSREGYVWLPEVREEQLPDDEWEEGEEDAGTGAAPAMGETPTRAPGELPPYDVEHYLGVLLGSYAGRLRKAFAAEDFEQLFRADAQVGLFDRPVGEIEPRWIGG